MQGDMDFLVGQVLHWLATPTNGYLGSDYGVDLRQYLHRPMSQFDADGIIAKMYADIPALALVGKGKVNVFVRDEGIDGKQIWIQLADRVVRAV